MEFESVKEWIVYLDTHPYILANNMRIFCQGFMPVLKEICRMVEQKLDDETFEFTLNEED
ncbi:MAG: hypothetical protein E7270_01545 [Lachnospiraceae bacterium]|nr:hypothetical protein [Lachnospiraceae bacterium]